MENEIVNLATFEFDVSRLTKSVDELSGRMFDLRKQQEGNNAVMKQAQKEINDLVKVQKLLENANQENSDAYKQNEARIEALTTAQKANYKVQQETVTQISKVRTELNQTNTQLKAYMTTEGEYISLIQKGNIALNTQINNKNEAVANNKALREVVNQLNPAIQEEADLIKLLNERVDDNTQYIRENSSGYDQLKMDIGSYKEQIVAAYRELNPMNEGLTGLIGRAQEAGGVMPLLSNSFTALRTGILGALKAGLAFLATPIGAAIGLLAVAVGAVVGAFKFMTASMNSTEEGSQKLAKVTGAITGIFNGLFKVIKPLGEFLGEVFIAYIEAAGEALDMLVTGLADAAEFLGFDGAAESIREVQSEVKASAIAAMELAAAEGELDKAQRQSRKTQLLFQKDAEKLRQQRDDETKTVSERIAINEQLGQVLQKQLAEELKLAEVALKVANLRLKSEGETKEALDAQAAAQTEIVDIQERLAGQESEQLAALNGLRKEAAAQEAERRQKALDDAIQKTKEELDYYIASQGEKRKSMQEELNYEEEISRKRLAALKKEYDAGKISKLAYETEKLNITNEYAQKQIEITSNYANAEIELWRQVNQSRITDETILTEAIISEEIRRLEEQERLQLEQLAREKQTNDQVIADKLARNEQLSLADLEYQVQRLAIEQQTNEQIDANKQKFDAQIKERDLAQAEADKELALLNAETEYETQLIEEEARFQEGLVSLQEQLKQQLITEQQYNDLRDAMEHDNAEKEKKINQAKEMAIREQYATTFGQVAKLFGEKTAVGKAAAIAEATMNTYNGVTQVWASPSLLPEPIATVAKGVSTGVVIASGLAAVKKIVSTDAKQQATPSYARGVIGVSGSGTGDSDSIPANLSFGESVINANSTAMFPELLSAINQIGGGVGIDASSSIMAQNSITQGADNSQMSTVIANAVYEGSLMGTAKGSESGIIGLSENRQIQQNAQF